MQWLKLIREPSTTVKLLQHTCCICDEVLLNNKSLHADDATIAIVHAPNHAPRCAHPSCLKDAHAQLQTLVSEKVKVLPICSDSKDEASGNKSAAETLSLSPVFMDNYFQQPNQVDKNATALSCIDLYGWPTQNTGLWPSMPLTAIYTANRDTRLQAPSWLNLRHLCQCISVFDVTPDPRIPGGMETPILHARTNQFARTNPALGLAAAWLVENKATNHHTLVLHQRGPDKSIATALLNSIAHTQDETQRTMSTQRARLIQFIIPRPSQPLHTTCTMLSVTNHGQRAFIRSNITASPTLEKHLFLPIGTVLYQWMPGKHTHLTTTITHPVSLAPGTQLEKDLHPHDTDAGTWTLVSPDEYESIRLS